MEKIKYEAPELEIIVFKADDVIITSTFGYEEMEGEI